MSDESRKYDTTTRNLKAEILEGNPKFGSIDDVLKCVYSIEAPKHKAALREWYSVGLPGGISPEQQDALLAEDKDYQADLRAMEINLTKNIRATLEKLLMKSQSIVDQRASIVEAGMIELKDARGQYNKDYAALQDALQGLEAKKGIIANNLTESEKLLAGAKTKEAEAEATYARAVQALSEAEAAKRQAEIAKQQAELPPGIEIVPIPKPSTSSGAIEFPQGPAKV